MATLKSGRQQQQNEDISINAGITNNNSNMVIEEESSSSSYPELKTPTGQQSSHYITPTSNIGITQAKKLGQNAP